eukprot:9498366-Pyramimonas_sp.AAC.4
MGKKGNAKPKAKGRVPRKDRAEEVREHENALARLRYPGVPRWLSRCPSGARGGLKGLAQGAREVPHRTREACNKEGAVKNSRPRETQVGQNLGRDRRRGHSWGFVFRPEDWMRGGERGE